MWEMYKPGAGLVQVSGQEWVPDRKLRTPDVIRVPHEENTELAACMSLSNEANVGRNGEECMKRARKILRGMIGLSDNANVRNVDYDARTLEWVVTYRPAALMKIYRVPFDAITLPESIACPACGEVTCKPSDFTPLLVPLKWEDGAFPEGAIVYKWDCDFSKLEYLFCVQHESFPEHAPGALLPVVEMAS